MNAAFALRLPGEQSPAGKSSTDLAGRSVDVNGRRYRLPVEPTVVVCVDGCE